MYVWYFVSSIDKDNVNRGRLTISVKISTQEKQSKQGNRIPEIKLVVGLPKCINKH